MEIVRCNICNNVISVVHTVRLDHLSEDVRKSSEQKDPKMVPTCRASSAFGLCRGCYLRSKKRKGETNCDHPSNSCMKYNKSDGTCLYLTTGD